MFRVHDAARRIIIADVELRLILTNVVAVLLLVAVVKRCRFVCLSCFLCLFTIILFIKYHDIIIIVILLCESLDDYN